MIAKRQREGAYITLLAIVIALGLGCSGEDSPKPQDTAQSGKAQGGFAAGRVTMPDGKPITAPGASISVSINGVSGAGERVSYSPPVKPDGTYRQKLAGGAYTFGRSTVEVDFEGKRYRFRLEPVGDEHNRSRESDAGITQDFVWKVTGERP